MDKRKQIPNLPASGGIRQWQRSPAATESHRWISHYTPTRGRNLNCLPVRISHIQPEAAILVTHPDEDQFLLPFELSPCFEKPYSIFQGLSIRGASFILVKPPHE